MNRKTSPRILFTISLSTLLLILGCYQSPISWSPDGKRVAFVQVRKAPGEKQLSQLSNGKHLGHSRGHSRAYPGIRGIRALHGCRFR